MSIFDPPVRMVSRLDSSLGIKKEFFSMGGGGNNELTC